MGTENSPIPQRRLPSGIALALAVAAVAAWLALAPSALRADTTSATPTAPSTKPQLSATLGQCVTAETQAERSATFAGEMAAIPGAAKLEMRIEVLERLPHELDFHAVTAPGLGVWRTAALGVKNYTYLKEVTNLAAPAVYRAAVRFRWLNRKGKLIRSAELKTARCVQPAVPAKTPEEAAVTS